jgi:hypothetical protein
VACGAQAAALGDVKTSCIPHTTCTAGLRRIAAAWTVAAAWAENSLSALAVAPVAAWPLRCPCHRAVWIEPIQQGKVWVRIALVAITNWQRLAIAARADEGCGTAGKGLTAHAKRAWWSRLLRSASICAVGVEAILLDEVTIGVAHMSFPYIGRLSLRNTRTDDRSPSTGRGMHAAGASKVAGRGCIGCDSASLIANVARRAQAAA